VHEGWITVKFNKEDAHIFRKKSGHLAYEIFKLLAEGEEMKVFLNPNVGLTFGGEITKTNSAKLYKGKNITQPR